MSQNDTNALIRCQGCEWCKRVGLCTARRVDTGGRQGSEYQPISHWDICPITGERTKGPHHLRGSK